MHVLVPFVYHATRLPCYVIHGRVYTVHMLASVAYHASLLALTAQENTHRRCNQSNIVPLAANNKVLAKSYNGYLLCCIGVLASHLPPPPSAQQVRVTGGRDPDESYRRTSSDGRTDRSMQKFQVSLSLPPRAEYASKTLASAPAWRTRSPPQTPTLPPCVCSIAVRSPAATRQVLFATSWAGC